MQRFDTQQTGDPSTPIPALTPPWAATATNPVLAGPGGDTANAARLFGHYAEQLSIPQPAPLDIPGQGLPPVPDVHLRMPQVGESARPVNTADPAAPAPPTAADLYRTPIGP